MALQVRRHVTNVALTSVAALLTSSLLRSVKGKPQRRTLLFKRSLIVSGVGLSTGLTVGFVLKTLRRQPKSVVFTSSFTGAVSGAVTGGVFFSLREILAQEKFNDIFPRREKSRGYFISATSGGGTGAVITLFTARHIIPMLSAGALGFVVGAVMHVMYEIGMTWRYNFLLRQTYPEYAEELIKQLSENGDQENSNNNPGYLLRPYRKFRVILSDLDDRMMGRTGRSAIQKLMLERRLQLQLLEDQENKLRSQLEMTQPDVQVMYKESNHNF